MKKCRLFSEGQPESIVQDIENMVQSYVEKVLIHLTREVWEIAFVLIFTFL